MRFQMRPPCRWSFWISALLLENISPGGLWFEMWHGTSWRKKLRDPLFSHSIFSERGLDLDEWVWALSQVSSAHILHGICSCADSSASCWQLYKHLWDWFSNRVYSSYSEPNWVDSCNSSELYSVLSEWMKEVGAASSPHGLLGGLGRKDKTRAPTKLLRECRVIDSQCSRLIFAGNDGSHCELSICLTCPQELT